MKFSTCCSLIQYSMTTAIEIMALGKSSIHSLHPYNLETALAEGPEDGQASKWSALVLAEELGVFAQIA